ncbi:hypothetical protein JOB18_012058 [Solea senegalensis]|uniref:Uncharacterized protein n=1 Tax=Solea senegalensis TaxID=28829 RepID=A0AAV6S4S7_SOLSE|nr:hypothetical protein JOB18_012058 [Solea senegalensis]
MDAAAKGSAGEKWREKVRRLREYLQLCDTLGDECATTKEDSVANAHNTKQEQDDSTQQASLFPSRRQLSGRANERKPEQRQEGHSFSCSEKTLTARPAITPPPLPPTTTTSYTQLCPQSPRQRAQLTGFGEAQLDTTRGSIWGQGSVHPPIIAWLTMPAGGTRDGATAAPGKAAPGAPNHGWCDF